MKNKKKKLIAILLALVCLFVVVLGSFAFFTSAPERTRNIITTGGIDVELREYADGERKTEFPAEGVTGVMPGTSVAKFVEVENVGPSAAWVRAKVEVEIKLAEGVTGTPDTSLVALEIGDGWTYSGGWYYYNAKLEPTDVTPWLLKSVSFDTGMDNMYQNSTAEVKVSAQAVQVANNGDTVDAALGWPAEEGGD